MAKKSLILSNDDGRVFIPTTSSFSIDDATENISVTAVTASTLKINGIADNTHRLLQINSSGTASVFNNNTVGDSTLVWDGSSWTNNNAVIGSRYGGVTGGDLSGSIEGNIKVLSVANVNAGALPTNHGGTNTSLAAANSSHILQVSKAGSTVTYSKITGSANLYPTVVNNEIIVKESSAYPHVTFYSSPGSFTWTKPAGVKFVRIILQGAGGGGGGGRVSASPAYGGAGGASGGFSDIVLNISSVSSPITIAVGAGGAGGTGGGTGGGTTTAGATGGTTSAIVSSILYSSTGGTGGRAGGTAVTSVSIGGTGLTMSGGAGASSSGIAAATTYGMPSGGGKGNGTPSALSTGGTVVTMFDSTNKNFGYSRDANNNVVTIPLSAGATGTVYTSTPAKPGFGAGGGGGGATTTSGQFGNGGPGGDGYALIIAW